MTHGRLSFNVYRFVSGPDFADRREYVEQCSATPPGFVATKWTTDPKKARTFGANVAPAVARRNAGFTCTTSATAQHADGVPDDLPL